MGKRRALLIGNKTYGDPRNDLPAVQKDLDLMQNTLTRMKYSCETADDCTYSGMDRALDGFLASDTGEDDRGLDLNCGTIQTKA